MSAWLLVLTVCIRPLHPFWKAEAPYRHHRLASYGCAWCRVQLTYVAELYQQSNGTAHTCVNSAGAPLRFLSSAWEQGWYVLKDAVKFHQLGVSQL